MFFSLCQTPVDGYCPSEAQMFRNFFEQVEAADRLGFGVGWVAEAHLSTQVQKRTRQPVVPHWQGEVGLNVDLLQLAHKVFARTRRLEVGSAVMNILCNGGPVAAAERVAAFATLHGLDPAESRRLHVGFAAGRFEFNNRPYGLLPRDGIEEAAWPALRGRVFTEAATIFLRLLRGDTFGSDEVPPTVLRRDDFRSDADWGAVQEAAVKVRHLSAPPDELAFAPRFVFEPLEVVPRHWRRELVVPVIGSHEPALQRWANTICPVQVFNLSITKPEVIEETHRRMAEAYHRGGGPWKRSYMPRTVMVFLNEQPGLGAQQRTAAARTEATAALRAYWKALEGTVDPRRVEQAADNAVIGNADDVASQLRERFHPDDRLMLWFDFFNHDSTRVVANMEAFIDLVVPQLDRGRAG